MSRNKGRGMSGHQRPDTCLTNEWLTPPELLKSLGEFDLDPCAPVNRPWDTALKHYTINDDGLLCAWHGRVWMNPPYGPHTGEWLAKLSQHGNGIALIFARTETKPFFKYVWDKADALLFMRGRISFYWVDGTCPGNNCGAPSVLIAYGKNNVDALRSSKIDGKFIDLRVETR